jgi:hypothetical protein
MTWADLNGRTVIKSSESWIRKTAPIEQGNSIVGRAWTFGLADAELFVGGAGEF